MSDQMTQAEIDALLNGSATMEPEPTDERLSQDVKDIIGEVGNISMSQAATTLSTLLNRKVSITTPKVKGSTIKKIIEGSNTPKVVTTIAFKEGLIGKNILMIDVDDAIIIADLMMGNDGKNLEDKEFTDLELSAVSEAMNQMIGSASTAMATMFDRRVDISPPDVKVWETLDDADLDTTNQDELVCTTSFNISVEGLLESEIMQVLPVDTVVEISEIMVGDEAEVIAGRESISVKKVEETIKENEPEETKSKATESVDIKKPKFQDLPRQR